MWGSGLGSRVRPGPHALLPTKNSCWCIQSFGRNPVIDRTPSQVALTLLIMDFVRFIFVAVILSLVSLLLMLLSHLVWISFSVWCLCWMTRSHRNTHIRWADSVSRICRSLTAPPSVRLPCCSSFGCWGWLMLVMPPHPRMIPSVISGH